MAPPAAQQQAGDLLLGLAQLDNSRMPTIANTAANVLRKNYDAQNQQAANLLLELAKLDNSTMPMITKAATEVWRNSENAQKQQAGDLLLELAKLDKSTMQHIVTTAADLYTKGNDAHKQIAGNLLLELAKLDNFPEQKADAATYVLRWGDGAQKQQAGNLLLELANSELIMADERVLIAAYLLHYGLPAAQQQASDLLLELAKLDNTKQKADAATYVLRWGNDAHKQQAGNLLLDLANSELIMAGERVRAATHLLGWGNEAQKQQAANLLLDLAKAGTLSAEQLKDLGLDLFRGNNDTVKKIVANLFLDFAQLDTVAPQKRIDAIGLILHYGNEENKKTAVDLLLGFAKIDPFPKQELNKIATDLFRIDIDSGPRLMLELAKLGTLPLETLINTGMHALRDGNDKDKQIAANLLLDFANIDTFDAYKRIAAITNVLTYGTDELKEKSAKLLLELLKLDSFPPNEELTAVIALLRHGNDELKQKAGNLFLEFATSGIFSYRDLINDCKDLMVVAGSEAYKTGAQLLLELANLEDCPAEQKTEALKLWANRKDAQGRPVLVEAAGNGDTQIVNELIAAGADLEDKDNDGNTALILAAKRGHVQIMDTLVDNGANLYNSPEYPDQSSVLRMAYQHPSSKAWIKAKIQANILEGEFRLVHERIARLVDACFNLRDLHKKSSYGDYFGGMDETLAYESLTEIWEEFEKLPANNDFKAYAENINATINTLIKDYKQQEMLSAQEQAEQISQKVSTGVLFTFNVKLAGHVANVTIEGDTLAYSNRGARLEGPDGKVVDGDKSGICLIDIKGKRDLFTPEFMQKLQDGDFETIKKIFSWPRLGFLMRKPQSKRGNCAMVEPKARFLVPIILTCAKTMGIDFAQADAPKRMEVLRKALPLYRDFTLFHRTKLLTDYKKNAIEGVDKQAIVAAAEEELVRFCKARADNSDNTPRYKTLDNVIVGQ